MKFLSELSTDSFICSELQVKYYKELLKCSFGDEPNERIFIDTICEICSKVTNKDSEYFKQLNVIDLFCLLLDIRINSQGDVCKVVVTKDEKQMNLELRLDYIKEELKAIHKLFSNLTIKSNDLEVMFECPSSERLLQKADEEYFYFIKNIYSTSSGKHININTNNEAKLLCEKLPAKISLQIMQKFEELVKCITSINFLSRYGITEQNLIFFPTLSSLIWFVKLIFGESLETFYDNLFYLSHLGHMSTEYIESSVVGEYNYFVSCLQRTLAAKNGPQEPTEQFISDEEAGFIDEPA